MPKFSIDCLRINKRKYFYLSLDGGPQMIELGGKDHFQLENLEKLIRGMNGEISGNFAFKINTKSDITLLYDSIQRRVSMWFLDKDRPNDGYFQINIDLIDCKSIFERMLNELKDSE